MSTKAERQKSPRALSFRQTLLIAIAIEAGLLLGTGGLILNAVAQVQPLPDRPVEISIAEPEKKEIPKEKPKPEPRHEPKPAPVPVPIVHTAAPVPTPPLAVSTPTPAPIIDSPIVEPPVPVITPPPQRTNSIAEREAEFAAKVKAAIQAAVVYPPAARSMGFIGRARVEFQLLDGIPSQIRILQGSGIGMIDRAALASVSNASYPVAPESLRGKSQLYQVTVLFELNASR